MRARLGVARHEELADGVMAGLGQREAELGAFLGEEAVRNLRQHAAAVAERRVRAGRAAMVEIDEDLQTLFQDRVRLCGCAGRRRSRRRRNRAPSPGRTGRRRGAWRGPRRAERGQASRSSLHSLGTWSAHVSRAGYRIFGSSNSIAVVRTGASGADTEIRRGVSGVWRIVRRVRHDAARPSLAAVARSARMGQQGCPISVNMAESIASRQGVARPAGDIFSPQNRRASRLSSAGACMRAPTGDET